jgi:hypothetical protein
MQSPKFVVENLELNICQQKQKLSLLFVSLDCFLKVAANQQEPQLLLLLLLLLIFILISYLYHTLLELSAETS